MTKRSHDNLNWPEGIRPRDYIKATMIDGTLCYGEAGNFDWVHDTDPVVAFEVLRYDNTDRRKLH